jgi:hypothetical protein
LYLPSVELRAVVGQSNLQVSTHVVVLAANLTKAGEC